jgi:hypothetical protein
LKHDLFLQRVDTVKAERELRRSLLPWNTLPTGEAGAKRHNQQQALILEWPHFCHQGWTGFHAQSNVALTAFAESMAHCVCVEIAGAQPPED